MIYPLNETTPEAAGLAPKPLAALDALIRRHLDEDRYPGAQIAIARNGKLALLRSYGDARTEPAHVPVTNDTLFLLFSQTKVLTSSAVWTLVEDGALSFMDRVADHLPEFAARGKGEITLEQVMTHRGGFPSAEVSRACWTDHARMRAEVCDFSLEWTPGSRLQSPQPGSASCAGHGDRGRHGPGLPRRDPHPCHRAARSGKRHLRRRPGGAANPLRRHPCTRTTRQFRRIPRGRTCRAAVDSPLRAAWPPSIRCWCMEAGWATCACSHRG